MTFLGAGMDAAILAGGNSYEAYIQRLSPPLWLAMTGTGATEVNKGTQGATLDGTITNMGAQGIAGKIAADSAHLYNADAGAGASSRVVVPNAAGIGSLSQHTTVSLVIWFSLGASSFPPYWRFNKSNSSFVLNSTTVVGADRKCATTNALSVGTFSTIGRILAKPMVMYSTYDDDGDRKIRLYAYDGTTFEEASYSTQTAGDGALTTEVVDLYVGETGHLNRASDGLYDEFLLFDKVLPDSQLERIGRLALARRWNSYSPKVMVLN